MSCSSGCDLLRRGSLWPPSFFAELLLGGGGGEGRGGGGVLAPTRTERRKRSLGHNLPLVLLLGKARGKAIRLPLVPDNDYVLQKSRRTHVFWSSTAYQECTRTCTLATAGSVSRCSKSLLLSSDWGVPNSPQAYYTCANPCTWSCLRKATL